MSPYDTIFGHDIARNTPVCHLHDPSCISLFLTPSLSNIDSDILHIYNYMYCDGFCRYTSISNLRFLFSSAWWPSASPCSLGSVQPRPAAPYEGGRPCPTAPWVEAWRCFMGKITGKSRENDGDVTGSLMRKQLRIYEQVWWLQLGWFMRSARMILLGYIRWQWKDMWRSIPQLGWE